MESVKGAQPLPLRLKLSHFFQMIMAERAADCLAKLGLDSQSPTSTGMASPISVAGNYGSNGGKAYRRDNLFVIGGRVFPR